jgi:protoheme IX farnesyltransferase
MAIMGFVSIAALAVTGAISALSHTLMPVRNVLAQAANPQAHWLQKLQPLHPYLSLAVGLFVGMMAGMLSHLRPSESVLKATKIMCAVFCAQLLIGLASIRLDAPIWMQMLHLVLGDAVFVSMVVAVALALRSDCPHREGIAARSSLAFKEAVRAYIALTKPRVISLLLFTAGAAMFAAAKGWPGLIPFLAVMLGGYMSAGAANTLNMVIDRDIDERMRRTSERPTVTQAISTSSAMLFALALTIGSFAVLWAGGSLLAAGIALAGEGFYVCVYTLYLKRRTWQNIVIGGAAGSVPPMVGWAAVTGNLSFAAWWMFALVFIWTPVHFWALALLLKDDYAEAGVPMLPVAKGERATASQISFYTALTVALSLLPFFTGYSGVIFLASAMVVDLILIRLCYRLYQSIERPRASALFHYSMLYLALLFLAVAVDQRWLIGNF